MSKKCKASSSSRELFNLCITIILFRSSACLEWYQHAKFFALDTEAHSNSIKLAHESQKVQEKGKCHQPFRCIPKNVIGESRIFRIPVRPVVFRIHRRVPAPCFTGHVPEHLISDEEEKRKGRNK